MIMHVDEQEGEKNYVLEDIYKYYGLALIQKDLQAEPQIPIVKKPVVEKRKKMRCLTKLKTKKWWSPLMKFLKFSVHFCVVMGILFAGATVFVMIEDPMDKYDVNAANKSVVNRTDLSREDFSDGSSSLFWLYLHQRYNVQLKYSARDEFLNDIEFFRDAVERIENEKVDEKKLKDRTNIFIKWFYFATIASTTIGYGDVAPTSKNGKLFYIGFSIVVIPLMMTLLASCGDIMTLVNKEIFGFINKCLCKKKKLVSEELLSAISIFLLFIGYVCVGCVFTTSTEKWMLVDSIYFWTVTFTTVGFGDVRLSLETEIEYMVPLVVYRCFGLALLAGCIDSIVAWMKVRRKALKKEAWRLKLNKSRKLAVPNVRYKYELTTTSEV